MSKGLSDREHVSQQLKLKCLSKILNNSLVCGLCLDSTDSVCSLEDYVVIEDEMDVKVEDLLNTLFGGQVASVSQSLTICALCIEKAINAYTFIKNAIQHALIISNYIEQIEKHIERTKISVTNCDRSQIYDNLVFKLEHPIVERSHDTITAKNTDAPLKNDVGEFTIQVGNSKTDNFCKECVSCVCKHSNYIKYFKEQQKDGCEIVKCRDCDKKMINIASFIHHVNNEHLQNYTCICEYCGKVFYSDESYQIHLKCDHTITFNCIKCKKLFSSLDKLDKHECSDQRKCDKTSESNSVVNALKPDQIQRSEWYICNICDRKFSNKTYLKRHIRMHSNKTRKKYKYICSICNKEFQSLLEKKNHVATHQSDEKHSCKLCNIQFDSSKKYLTHIYSMQHVMKTSPSGKKRHECTFCDYSSTMQNSLEAHINRYHYKIAPYKCDICDKSFFGRLKLNEHNKTHDTKKHFCEICNKYFCGATALKKHHRRHTGERPYLCEQCPERFISSTLKKRHVLKVHIDNKTYKCPLCDNTYHLLYEMRSHFKVNHWDGDRKEFDILKVPGLKPSDYELFRDRRMIS